MIKRSKLLATSVLALSCMFTANSHAVSPWWAWGKIEFVQQTPGNLVIGLTTTAADGCQYDRIYLYDSVLGETTVQRALSFALAAQASDKEMGLVIDADVKLAGGRCEALGNMVMR